MLALAVWPVGNFPLNDDWDYARSVRLFLEQRQFVLSPEARVTLLAQALWGALFSLPLGFSFEALRLSTLVAALGGIIATFTLTRLLGGGTLVSGIAALSLAVCPLVFVLAFTFMTDVPVTALSVAALALLVASLKKPTALLLALGTAACVAAVLVRPTALAVPVAFALAVVCSWPQPAAWGRALVPVLGAGVALAGWHLWMVGRGLAGLANVQAGELGAVLASGPAAVARAVAQQSGAAFLYLGLFTLPVTLLWLAGWLGSASARLRLALVMALLVGGGAPLLLGVRMPVAENVLYDLGLGPLTLHDAFFGQPPAGTTAPGWLWPVVTALAGAGGVLASCALGAGVCQRWNARQRPAVLLLLFTLGFSFAPLAIAGFLDRYLIALLPPLLALLAPPGSSVPRWGVTNAALVLALFALFSVLAVRDYFAWNRARWTLLERWLQAGASPAAIDGGFEFNGWFTYDPTYRRRPGRSWWWVQDDQYLVAFTPIAGYRVVDREPYQRLLPPGDGAVLMLERTR
jgi:4-amino-4-deoxy-L-arabinose transferase-like glycosyltransferase